VRLWVHNAYQLHHPIPRFIGGNLSQDLYKVDSLLHKGAGASFHNLLAEDLRAAGFPRVGGVGGSYADWELFFRRNPGSQRQALDILLNRARDFDFVNGTQFLSKTWANIVKGNFRLIP